MSESGISRADVAHLAHLARIDLSEAELDRLGAELPVILDAVAQVQQASLDDVPPMSHPVALSNVFREDVPVAGLTPEQALAGAPEVEGQRFAVPKILGEE